MNGGQHLANALVENNIQHLFTLCGGHIGPIYVEAEKAGIRIWDVRHEATAVFAADAIGRLSGTAGVAAVTAGPGVTNTVTALKNAQLAQSPVLLLGGATATLLRNRGALQDIDQLALLHPAVKYGVRARYVRELRPLLLEALRQASGGVPGPTFLEVPVDLLYPEAIVREWYGKAGKKPGGLMDLLVRWYIQQHLNRLFAGNKQTGKKQTAQPAPAVNQISRSPLKEVENALLKAQRPVMLVGSGALQSPGLASELASAVNKLGIPAYFSGMARGLTGRNSAAQLHHHRKEALREADLILLAGVPCDFRLDYGRHLNRKARKIALSRNQTELSKNLRADTAVCLDPAAFLIELAKRAQPLPDWTTWKTTLKGRDAAREAEIEEMAGQTVSGINPLALFRLLEEALPENSVIVVDGGDFAATAAYSLRPRQALHWLDAGVYGTLGGGGGFALGAAAWYPDAYIWIIYGDGSAAYSLAEFETFAKNGLKVCGIVGNNGSWEQIARDQRTLLGAETAVNLPQSDYHLVVQGYGAAGEKTDDLPSFGLALRRAIRSMDQGVPYLINAMIGSTEFRKGSISM